MLMIVIKDTCFIIAAAIAIMMAARYMYTQEYFRMAKYLIIFIVGILVDMMMKNMEMQTLIYLILIVLFLVCFFIDKKIDKGKRGR